LRLRCEMCGYIEDMGRLTAYFGEIGITLVMELIAALERSVVRHTRSSSWPSARVPRKRTAK
jgi:hypothetical protein